MKPSKEVLFAAAFGGIAPTLLKSAIASQNSGFRLSLIFSEPMSALDTTAGFLFVATMMGVLGAGVAFAFQEQEIKKAFFIGLGLPSLLTVGNVTATQPPPVGSQQELRQEGSQLIPLFFSEVLYAQRDAVTKNASVLFKFPGDLQVTELLAIFDVRGGRDVARTFRVGDSVEIPAGAQSIELDSAVYFSEEIDLPSNVSGQIVITFQIERNRAFGFWSAIGVRSRPLRLVPIKR